MLDGVTGSSTKTMVQTKKSEECRPVREIAENLHTRAWVGVGGTPHRRQSSNAFRVPVDGDFLVAP
jgi:hypothetical protein